MKHSSTAARVFRRQSLFQGLPKVLLSVFITLMTVSAGASQPSQTMASILKRGSIAVGVKTDVAPFGMLDRDGKPVGFEVDLASLIASRLGVQLRTVSVTTENRFQRLEQGTVDMIIATAADTRERRELATAIEPDYYAGGANVMLPPGSRISSWNHVRQKSLCAIQSAYFNKPIAQKYGTSLLIFRNLNDAMSALRDHRCAGMLYSDVTILNYLRNPDWSGYGLLSPSDLNVPWAISIRRSEQGSRLERQLGDIVADLHRSGTLLALAQRWGLPPAGFLSDSHVLWNTRTEDGSYLCKRTPSGKWPEQCRYTLFSTSAASSADKGPNRFSGSVEGISLSFLRDPYDRQRYINGIMITCYLTLIPLALTLPVAASLFLMLVSRYRLIHISARFIANICRMTPPLLQMYLIYFAACGYLQAAFDLSVPAFVVAVVCLTAYHASIVSFSLEQGLRDIRVLRPAYAVSLRNIPTIMAFGAVSIRGALTNLSKATTIASAIAIPELLSVTLSIINDQGNTMVMMNLLLLAFFVSTSIWSALIRRTERWLISYARIS